MELPLRRRRCLVIAYDAGGAEIISSWIRRDRPSGRFEYLLSGPALTIFERKLEVRPYRGTVDAVDWVLTGSGSTIERAAVTWAMTSGKRTVSWVDSWKNYAQRFTLMPDEVWVTDEYAEQIARRDLPGATVRVRGNPYLEEMTAAISPPESHSPPHVLAIREPDRIPELSGYLGENHRDQEVRIRPHPSEGDSFRTLVEDLSWADVVVGCDSMALVVAARAGRRVISLIPEGERTIPWGKASLVPPLE